MEIEEINKMIWITTRDRGWEVLAIAMSVISNCGNQLHGRTSEGE
jgi:hypothetical protein